MGLSTRKIALSTTRDKLSIIPNSLRTSISILNEDSTINILIAESSSAAGFILFPQTAITFDFQGGNDPRLALQLWSASGTPNIRVMEWQV